MLEGDPSKSDMDSKHRGRKFRLESPGRTKLAQANYEGSFSTRFRFFLQLARGGLFRTVSSSEGKRMSRELYKEYLIVLHSIIRASVPLMRAAEQRCLELGDDQLSSVLAKYYRKHLKEEDGHDRWLLADLEVAGVNRSEVLSRRPLQAVAELVGSQYYWIFHFHPVCLLGYIAVLEGYPPSPEDVRRFIVETGYPEAAFRTLAKHSSLDQHHRDALNDFVDSLPLNREQEEWVTLNAIQTLKKWAEVVVSVQLAG